MDNHDDPFHDLDDWAKDAERRAKRAHRWGRVRRRAEAARTALWILSAVAAAVLLAGGIHYLRTGPADEDTDAGAGVYATGAVPSGLSVTTSASAAPTGPFEGTAAATFPKGDAGIAVPAATPVTGFTQAQVGAALQLVRQALVAGRLDQKMLVGHDSSAFLALLAPNARTEAAKWFADTRHANVATWIDPAVKLDPAEQPRVSGRVTFASNLVNDLQTLQITTNFVWVYAFDVRTARPIAAVHDSVRWEFPQTDRIRKEDRGMWIATSTSYLAWMDCAAADRGWLAPGKPVYSDARPSGTEPADAILRPDHTLDIGSDCTTTPASAKP